MVLIGNEKLLIYYIINMSEFQKIMITLKKSIIKVLVIVSEWRIEQVTACNRLE